MWELAIKGQIASAHYLRGYEGKCKNLHGHTWKIELFLQNDKLNSVGLVEDLSALRMKFTEFLKQIDHTNLNEHPAFLQVNPSVENISRFIYQEFQKQVSPLKITKVQVWESDTASAIYYE